jgi:hypothetical protein
VEEDEGDELDREAYITKRKPGSVGQVPKILDGVVEIPMAYNWFYLTCAVFFITSKNNREKEMFCWIFDKICVGLLIPCSIIHCCQIIIL